MGLLDTTTAPCCPHYHNTAFGWLKQFISSGLVLSRDEYFGQYGIQFLYHNKQSLGVGYTGFTLSICLSVCLSVTLLFPKYLD